MERNIFTSQGFLDKRAYQILRNKQSENQNSEKTGTIISIIKPYDWLKPDLISRLMTEAKSEFRAGTEQANYTLKTQIS
jgi:hypothetical protein